MSDDRYYEALALCADRYLDIAIQGKEYDITVFVAKFKEGINEKMPLLKLNRWLGYIQGVLIERGYSSVTEERNWSRPLFKLLDYPVKKD